MDRELTQEERKHIRRKRMRPIVIGACVIAVGGATIFSLMQPSVNRDSLIFAEVDTGTIETTVTGSGNVVPAFEEIINSPISSRLIEVYCKAGDTVDVGTPLLRLDLQSTETDLNKLTDQIRMKQYELDQQRINNDTHLKDLSMQIKVKEMSVDRMAAELRNEKYLDSLGSGTGDRVRQAELAYNTGRLELDQLRQRLANERLTGDAELKVKALDISITEKNLSEQLRTLDDARIRAPRRATLTFISNQIGQKVSEGEKVAIISDLSHFKIDGELPDGYADRVSVGSKVLVRVGRDKLPGMVTNITPMSQNGVMAFSVSLDDDDDPRLRSGLKADVYVRCGIVDNVVRIPNPSFYTGPGSYILFVNDNDNRLEQREVKLGAASYDYVEVQAGLNPGEKIVINDMTRYNNNKTLKLN